MLQNFMPRNLCVQGWIRKVLENFDKLKIRVNQGYVHIIVDVISLNHIQEFPSKPINVWILRRLERVFSTRAGLLLLLASAWDPNCHKRCARSIWNWRNWKWNVRKTFLFISKINSVTYMYLGFLDGINN